MLCAVLCMTVVHSDMHTREHFLNLHVGLGLDFFVCFCIIHVFVLAYIALFICCLLLLCLVLFLQYQAKRLAGTNIPEMTYSVSSGS